MDCVGENIKEVWSRTLSDLREEVSDHSFNTWLKPIHLKGFQDDQIFLQVPNNFYRDRIQHTYADKIRKNFERHFCRKPDISFVVSKERKESSSLLKDIRETQKVLDKPSPPKSEIDGMNLKHTFDTFVVGAGNQFAHAAAQAVAQAPGETYNPLFIYGGVGLGKTHLLCAVGDQIAKARPGSRVVYRTAERFMNDLINSIRYEKTLEFRSRYRESCDVLLVDDIQFLAGKERTQEEFFHTFNALHEANKQIVLTSDRFPKEIPDLDERLRSRFQSGLFCDIQPPDVETRVAILKKRAESESLVLPDDVALFLAKKVKSNIRVLEGAFIRLTAFASISRRPITLELTEEVFGSLAPEESRITIEAIQKRVAEFFNLNVADLKSSRRHKVVALPRQIAMYLSRKLTQASFPELGSRFGGKDHTTVMHAVQKVERLLDDDSPLRNSVSTIEKTLTSGV